MQRILFVCLGNICRSPMAEAVMEQLVAEAGLENQIQVDSAGTGAWHVGEMAHRGTRQVLAAHGIAYHGRSRQVQSSDVDDGAYIVAMDGSNVRELKRRFGELPHLHRLLDFAPQLDVQDVPDPYYSGNFEYVYRLVRAGCEGLLAEIREQL